MKQPSPGPTKKRVTTMTAFWILLQHLSHLSCTATNGTAHYGGSCVQAFVLHFRDGWEWAINGLGVFSA